MSKRKQKSLDEIYYGVEPHAEDERDKGRCMNWYNYMSDNKSCGEWLSTWMSDREYEDKYIKGVKRLKYVPRTAAALARMQTRSVPCMFEGDLLNPSTTAFFFPLEVCFKRDILKQSEKSSFNSRRMLYVLSLLFPSTNIISNLLGIFLNLLKAFIKSSLLPASFLAGITIDIKWSETFSLY